MLKNIKISEWFEDLTKIATQKTCFTYRSWCSIFLYVKEKLPTAFVCMCVCHNQNHSIFVKWFLNVSQKGQKTRLSELFVMFMMCNVFHLLYSMIFHINVRYTIHSTVKIHKLSWFKNIAFYHILHIYILYIQNAHPCHMYYKCSIAIKCYLKYIANCKFVGFRLK